MIYYNDALGDRIEAMEYLLDEALALPAEWGIWQDLSPLFRMDEGKMAEVETKLVGGGVKTPNEGRFKFGLEPLKGGDTVYMQQQDFPLDQVRKNKIVDGDQNPIPAPTEEEEERDFKAAFARALPHSDDDDFMIPKKSAVDAVRAISTLEFA